MQNILTETGSVRLRDVKNSITVENFSTVIEHTLPIHRIMIGSLIKITSNKCFN